LLTFDSTFASLASMKTEETFGQRIRELRLKKDLTQRDLAKRVDLDFTYLSKIENGKMSPPSVTAIIRLAKQLEADEDELLALAGKAPARLGQALKESKGARMFYRSALSTQLSDEDWEKLREALERRTKGKK